MDSGQSRSQRVDADFTTADISNIGSCFLNSCLLHVPQST
ncbi:hypothetical protein S7335_557 [Synechococcus sp. PCC 7335]|nr:hypothetical protein S7335_557 [Synechococcus sp. PCC 7335]